MKNKKIIAFMSQWGIPIAWLLGIGVLILYKLQYRLVAFGLLFPMCIVMILTLIYGHKDKSDYNSFD